MNIQEANEIIARYMGYKYVVSTQGMILSKYIGGKHGVKVSNLYSEDLNALEPVWDRDDFPYDDYHFYKYSDGTYCFQFRKYCDFKQMTFNYCMTWGCETLQKAACIATAKAIESLGK